ncbi:MAG: glycoside hydrolase [Actinomycetota bacterium]|nr:glycoside hydrolase [Actinomycetota bacterium]
MGKDAMKIRKVRVVAVAAALGGMAATFAGSAVAQPGPTPSTYRQVRFVEQDADVQKLTAPAHMTKDATEPARGFTSPTSMLVHPDNPRIVVAALANLRSRTCFLAVSRDAGRTWHFSKEPPADSRYPYCTNNNAGVPKAMIAWGRDNTLYYGLQAYGDGEGPREGRSSIMLARTTNLGDSWQYALVDNNRGKTGIAPSDTGVTGMAVDTSRDQDVVYVGFSQSFPDAPMDSPLREPHVMVATSTDGGRTFATPVDLNTFQRPNIEIAGKAYPLLMRTSFGAPFLIAREGIVLAVTGPALPSNDQPPPPPEAGSGLSPGSWYAYPMPQMIARSTDQGKTWTITTLGDPILAGTGSFTGLGWTPHGGDRGTFVAAYAATPATSPTIALADIVVQRSTDGGLTWTAPLAIDDDPPELHATSFYPQLNVAPNGRIDVAWQDNRDTKATDFHFDVRYTYSTDGGATWAKNIKVNDRRLNFNYGISFNSDLRYPVGVASTDEYVMIGWADTRHATDLTQTQDAYATAVQFAPLPATRNTTAPIIAAIFGGLLVAGLILLVVLQSRKRREGQAAPAPPSKEAVRT